MRNMTCQNPECKYSWTTNSRLLKVSCPSCGTKVNNRHNLKKEVEPNERANTANE